jgi:hypothetical protein
MPRFVDPFQIGAGLKMFSVAFQDNDAKQGFSA